MYPDLSYLFHDLFGTPRDNWISLFKTFGLFLVLAILTAAWLLRKELRRKAENGIFQPLEATVMTGRPASALELISNALFGFILGFKFFYAFQHLDELQEDAAGVLLSAEGNLFMGILGAVLFAGIKFWDARRKQLPQPRAEIIRIFPHDRIGEITIIAAICGVLGAKLFAVMEDWPQTLREFARSFLSGSGLAIYGGLIGGFIGVFAYLRAKKIPVIPVLDAVAPALIIAYGVGRLGCHFSGDGDWGIPVSGTHPLTQAAYDWSQPPAWLAWLPDWLWAYDYPHNVVNDGVMMEGCKGRYCNHLTPPVFPTPLWEAIAAFFIGGVLWALRQSITIPGALFSLYLVLNGIERFFIEKIRVNPRYEAYFNLTQAEIIAIAFVAAGVLGFAAFWRGNRGIEELRNRGTEESRN